jgi:hypothetical protein
MEGVARAKAPGWIMFAAVILYAVGFLRIITAISYLADSHKINNFASGLFSTNLWVWGLWDLVIAALALFGGWSLINGGEFGRIVAYAWGVVVLVNSFLVINIAPWYAAATMALGILVIYGVARSFDWGEVEVT